MLSCQAVFYNFLEIFEARSTAAWHRFAGEIFGRRVSGFRKIVLGDSLAYIRTERRSNPLVAPGTVDVSASQPPHFLAILAAAWRLLLPLRRRQISTTHSLSRCSMISWVWVFVLWAKPEHMVSIQWLRMFAREPPVGWGFEGRSKVLTTNELGIYI